MSLKLQPPGTVWKIPLKLECSWKCLERSVNYLMLLKISLELWNGWECL